MIRRICQRCHVAANLNSYWRPVCLRLRRWTHLAQTRLFGCLSFPPLIVCSFAARACKVDAERLCNNTWLVGAALDGSIISCLR